MTDFRLLTDATGADGFFDPRYTCDVDNSSPELRWSEPPEGTRSFAVVLETPARAGLVAMVDARDRAIPTAETSVLTHWLVYDIPASVRHLPAGIPPQEVLPNGIRQGLNSQGKLGYAGPCPPRGALPRNYIFRIYALALAPPLPGKLDREKLLEAIRGNILGEAEFGGRYRRIAPMEREKAG
jgi:hypothetical protein